MAKFYEKSRRSLVKALSFRVLIILSDGVIIFAITRRLDIAVAVIFFSNLASTVLYFLHERFWDRIHWGKTARK